MSLDFILRLLLMMVLSFFGGGMLIVAFIVILALVWDYSKPYNIADVLNINKLVWGFSIAFFVFWLIAEKGVVK